MKTKKTICIIVISLLLLFGYPLAMMFGHMTNIICSKSMENDITKCLNSAKTMEIVEIKTAHGKLVGNGNGMQYRCDILVKGEPTDSVTDAVKELKDKYWAVEIVIPEDNKFSILYSNTPLSFSNEDFNESSGKGYYVIYVFEDRLVPFMGKIDLCGH